MCSDKMSIFVRGSEVDNMQTQLSVHSAHLSTAHPWHCQSRNLGHGHPELLIGHAWAGNPFIVGDRGHGTMKHSCGYGYYYLHYGGVGAWHLVTAGTERFCSNTVSLGCNVEDLGLTCYCNAIKWDINIVSLLFNFIIYLLKKIYFQLQYRHDGCGLHGGGGRGGRILGGVAEQRAAAWPGGGAAGRGSGVAW